MDVPWYADQRVSVAPDYMNDEASWAVVPGCALPWSDLPHHRPPELITVHGDSLCSYSETKVSAQATERTEPLVDCFFVHPTTVSVRLLPLRLTVCIRDAVRVGARS